MTIPVNIESPMDSRMDNCMPAGAEERADAGAVDGKEKNKIMENKNRVVFRPHGRLGLVKGESILRAEIMPNYSDINDVLELYNLKKYIDNDIFLESWSQEDIVLFRQKAKEYGSIVSKFMATISNENIESFYNNIIFNYKSSFWEIVNNQGFYKNISSEKIKAVLDNNPHIIRTILRNEKIVNHYNNVVRTFMLAHPESAEIILSIYEIKPDNIKEPLYLPKNLTIKDKENIIDNYLDWDGANYNYFIIIRNARNGNDFRLSDKIRLKAQKLHDKRTQDFFATNTGIKFGISICFSEDIDKVKSVELSKDHTISYSYSLNFIKQNNNPYALFENFFYLFEYLDEQYRIALVSKESDLGTLERCIGVHSQNEYRASFRFRQAENTSFLQMVSYTAVLEKIGYSIENILCQVFTSIFPEKYGFASNSRLMISTASNLLEKVRLLAPELESILKQYKLFVEDRRIDFDLLQISSNPTSIKDIPSLNSNKYLYINNENSDLQQIVNLFFSDQTMLDYVEPFKERYHTLFELLTHEDVLFKNYDEYQKPELYYLIDKNYLYINENGYLQFVNLPRVSILYDLYSNEVASFYRYNPEYRYEVIQMEKERLVYFESTLFSIPEQAYFNYYLNKSLFTNGLDLRNKYLHGTQANPEDEGSHKYAYYTYLKLIVLALLKIEDDLIIHKALESAKSQL